MMETRGFVAHDNGRFKLPVDFGNFGTLLYADEATVTVLRSLLFFHAEEKTTIGRLREFFTEKSITMFKNDGYIRIDTL